MNGSTAARWTLRRRTLRCLRNLTLLADGRRTPPPGPRLARRSVLHAAVGQLRVADMLLAEPAVHLPEQAVRGLWDLLTDGRRSPVFGESAADAAAAARLVADELVATFWVAGAGPDAETGALRART